MQNQRMRKNQRQQKERNRQMLQVAIQRRLIKTMRKNLVDRKLLQLWYFFSKFDMLHYCWGTIKCPLWGSELLSFLTVSRCILIL